MSGARFSNYTAWIASPVSVKPVAQIVSSGAALMVQELINGDGGASSGGIRITSGLFHVWRSVGITGQASLFVTAIGCLVLSAVFLVAGWYHHHLAVPSTGWFNDVDAVLHHHVSAIVGLGCLSWAGHLIHVAVPVDAALRLGVDPEAAALDWLSLAPASSIGSAGYGAVHLFGLEWWELTSVLTAFGGTNPTTGSLWLTDVAHHHLALGVVALVAGHMYKTQFQIGTTFSGILRSHHTTFMSSWHAQLAINLGTLGTGSLLLAHLALALPTYAYLAMDWSTELSLFTHHAWIGGFCIVGAGAHAALYLVTDYRVG